MKESPTEIAAGRYRCPTCGAMNQTSANPSNVLKCWLCTHSFTRDGTKVADNAVAEPRNPLEKQGVTFGLTTLMLIVTMAAIGFGIFRSAPGLGILFFVLLTPALVRAQIITMRQRELGVAQSVIEVFATFVVSLGVTMFVLGLVLIAAVIAFVGTCFYAFSQF